jgi:gliding motility-associated-like protein
MKRFITIIFISLMVSQVALGDHFMGVDIYMKPMRNPTQFANYTFYMNFYWNGNIYDSTEYAKRPHAENLAIFRKRDNKMMKNYELGVVGTGYEPVIFQNKKCAKQFGLNMYVSKYEYSYMLKEDEYDDPQGYYIYFDRCCRDKTLTNIDISNPDNLSMVVILNLPPLKKYPQYHSPQFIIPNGDFLCVGKPFQLNVGATDDDGDELRYSIVEPLSGYTAVNSTTPGVLAWTGNVVRTSFPTVKYATGFNGSNLIPGNPGLSIDKKGVISVTPTMQGNFVFGVLVEEYRNGVKIGDNRRDYMLSVKDCNNSSPTVPQIQYQNNPAPPVIQLCNGGIVDLYVDTTFTDYSLQWQKNLLNLPNATKGKITVSDTGTYTVVKSWKNQCTVDAKSNAVSFKIISSVNPVKIKADKLSACEGNDITLSLIDPSQVVNWYLETTSLGASKTLIAKKSGKYFGKINVAGCPSKEDNMVLTFLPSPKLPPPDNSVYLICNGDKVELKTLSNPNFNYQWLKNNTNVSSAMAYNYEANAIGDYTVKVVDNTNSCDAISQVYQVKLKTNCGGVISTPSHTKLLVPTAFTPNADGTNDTWQIFGIENYPESEVFIYNRWGELIFYSKGYLTPFDGEMSNGSALPEETYAYVIKVVNPSAEGYELRGAFSLLR